MRRAWGRLIHKQWLIFYLFALSVIDILAFLAVYAANSGTYFRAIIGPGYPLAPRNWTELSKLFLFYLFTNLVMWLMPMGVTGSLPLSRNCTS